MRTKVFFTIGDIDVYAEIEFRCTYKGFAGDYNNPPESAEFEIDEFTLYHDDAARKNTQLECPKWLRDALENSDAVRDAMYETPADDDRDY
jgi:hypothetical protein